MSRKNSEYGQGAFQARQEELDVSLAAERGRYRRFPEYRTTLV